ncbi:MAG: hypothetical protein JNL90_06845 [Planctomycetes bacterium]|nr:hypothetical protein [Planctomycetota bacterium]
MNAMPCEEATPLLALAALDALEPEAARALDDHLASCARCAASHAELRAVRAALAADEVATAPPPELDLDAWRRSERPVVGGPRSSPRSSPLPLRRAAAAALLLLAALAAGALGARLAAPTTPIAAAPLAGDVGRDLDRDTAAPLAAANFDSLAGAIVLLEERLTAFEQRHVRDLLRLAEVVDRQQAQRDRAIAAEFATLVKSTGFELASAHEAVAQLALQVQPIAR